MKRHEVLEHLRKHGCGLVREGRRHSWWGNPANNRRSAVPRHSEIPEPLVRKICRDLGIPAPRVAVLESSELGCQIVTMPDRDAQRLSSLFPAGPRLVVIGSTDFYHDQSESTCTHVGRLLATIADLVLITGGVEGIGEATGRSFFSARREAEQEPRVYHVLPQGEPEWDYGDTLFAGSDMAERREILARLSSLYLAIEGGPGTVHEATVACARGATVIAVGRSGGHAAALYARMQRPAALDEATWAVLGDAASTPEQTANAVLRAVRACLAS